MRRYSLFLLGLLVGCRDSSSYAIATGPRDWATHPAVATLDAPVDLYAASDIHGGYDRFVALLAANHLVAAMPATPDAVQWAGGAATLVIVGDLFDKGPQGLEVVDLLRALETSAHDQGGAVVVTLGNHEAEFFADPMSSKAEADDGIDKELATESIDPIAVASGADPRGAWLRERPFAAKIGAWFFAHAGDTHGRTLADLSTALQAGYDANDFRDPEFAADDSILEARDWYEDPAVVMAATAALGADHIAFGHDPNALGARGAIASAQSGALVRIDCGMSPDVDDSHGMLLHVRGNVVEQLDANGSATKLP